MPDYSPIEEIDQSKPLDMSNVKYGAMDIFKVGLSASYGNLMSNQLLKLKNADQAVGDAAPADNDYIESIKKDRPGFNAPTGVPKFVVTQLQKQYDNNKYFEKLKSRPASFMGNVSAFVSSMGGMLDTKNFIYGLSGAKAAEAVVAPIAESYITRLAANDIIGVGTAKVGTAISDAAVSNAGFGLAAGIEETSEQFTREDTLGEPHHYIDALQNLGKATLYGAIAGVGFHGAGRVIGFGRDALIGKRVEITPEENITLQPEANFTTHNRYETESEAQTAASSHQESTVVPHEYAIHESSIGDYILTKRSKGGEFTIPATYERQGGLLERLDIPQRTKDILANLTKPWTKAADDVTKTEAVGQMANGNLVNIEPVIKQGMYEEGIAFREALAREDINPAELDNVLSTEQEKIVSDMFVRYFAEKNKALQNLNLEIYESGNSFGVMYNPEGTVLASNSIGLVKRGNRAIVAKSEIRPEHRGKGIGKALYKAAIDEANKRDLNFESDVVVTDDAMRVYKSLEKDGYEFEYNPEVKRVKNTLPSGTPLDEFPETFRTESLNDEPVIKLKSSPKKPDIKLIKESTDDLAIQHDIIQLMRDHLNDSHEPLTQGEMEAYSQHLQESNMPATGADISPGEYYKLDEQLAQYSEEDIKSLAELTDRSEVGGKEIIESAEKLKNQNVYAEMAEKLTDCIMRGGL